uniref:Uncharacterized protein n=1 Tax=Rhizophagus irregularis (strain DAOM 181602 / DAOM 197198 / MUCL 43194) TaxID=747089 RepID=U9SJ31_RHIID
MYPKRGKNLLSSSCNLQPIPNFFVFFFTSWDRRKGLGNASTKFSPVDVLCVDDGTIYAHINIGAFGGNNSQIDTIIRNFLE